MFMLSAADVRTACRGCVQLDTRPPTKGSIAPGYFRLWHDSDEPIVANRVRSWGKSGRQMLNANSPGFDLEQT